jgi:cytochrome d ubiquinol oxidase subunit I
MFACLATRIFLVTVFSLSVATTAWAEQKAVPTEHPPASSTISSSAVLPLKSPELVTSRDVWYKTEGIVSGPPTHWIRSEDYPRLNFPNPFGESRLIIWILAQQHKYWGGFVLGVLFLVMVLEVRALVARNGDTAKRYDGLAYEMLGLIMLALAITAILGAIFLFSLVTLYPDFTKYLFGIFRPTLLLYGLLALVLSLLAYLYYYSWKQMSAGFSKWIHASLGVLVNVIGTIMVLLANAWGSFMMAPAGVDSSGRFLGNYWNVLHTTVWNPFNVHRIVSNIILGAAVMAAYAAFRALTVKTQGERAHYDWMGYIALFTVVFALFSVPFGGYWLFREIYAYRQQMGITLAGGLLAWLALILVLLIGALFVGINYYLWQRINSLEGRDHYSRYAKYVFFILTVCIMVYITPHTMVMTAKEVLDMHGHLHPVLGNYGVMSAKNVAVNIMIVVTMWSLILWWKCKFQEIDSVHKKYDGILLVAFIAGIVNLIWLGIYGYYIPANIRVGLSVPMMATTLSLIILGVATHLMAKRENHEVRPVWGNLTVRGYFALFFLAFVVTWIMGLGGYRRSSLRLFWHVNELLHDNSPWAFTHTIGFAANVISMNALIFWLGLLFILWLTRLGKKPEEKGF